MKTKTLITALALVCTAALTAGTVAAAPFAYRQQSRLGWNSVQKVDVGGEAESNEGVVFALPLLNNAVREYFGLEEGEALTEDMTAQIETIEFRLSMWQDGLVKLEGYEDKYAVKCIINGGALIGEDGETCESIAENILDRTFNGRKGLLGYEVLPVTVRSSCLRADEIADEWLRTKMNAFYTTKSMAILELLEPAAAEEVLKMHPALAVDDLSFLDPMAKPRELAELLKDGMETGIVNADAILDSMVIEISKQDIARIPNAFSIRCEDGFTVEYVN